MIAALGGPKAVRKVEVGAGRVLLTVAPDARIDERALEALGIHGVGRLSPTSVHLLHPDADALAEAIEEGTRD